MERRITAAEVIATRIGYDLAEMSDYRYQPSRYANPAIYAVDDAYYCVLTKANRKLHKGWKWGFEATVLGRDIFSAGMEVAD